MEIKQKMPVSVKTWDAFLCGSRTIPTTITKWISHNEILNLFEQMCQHHSEGKKKIKNKQKGTSMFCMLMDKEQQHLVSQIITFAVAL